MAISGVGSYAIWKVENTFKTPAGTNWRAFGHDVKLSTFSAKNNVRSIYGLGNQQANAMVGLQFEGSVSVSCIMGDPWFLRFLTGNTPTTTGSGPYTHTYVDTSTSKPLGLAVQSITIETGDELGATDSVRSLRGCVLKTLRLSAKVDSPVEMTMDFDYADEVHSTTMTTNVNPTDAPYTFAYGSIELPTGTTLTGVQSVDLTINRNSEIKRGLGARTGSFYFSKKAEYDVKVSLPYENRNLLELFYGASGSTSPRSILTEQIGVKLVFDNGQTGTARRNITFEFTGSLIDTIDMNKDVDEMITQELTIPCRVMKLAQAINNTATEPS